MHVSILVVAFNEAHVLAMVKQGFDALIRPDGIELETILIDGGSRDGTPDMAREVGFDHVLLCPQANIPTCRNAGLKAARGEWIAFVDADCILSPDWLDHAARLLRRHAPLVLGWPAAPPTPGTWVQRAWHAHWMTKNLRLETEVGEQVLKHQGFRMITTRNMIFHRSVADMIGGFDETLATGEDTDFVFRATQAGILVWGLPALRSIHLGEPDTLKKFYKQQVWHANRRAYKTILEKSGMKTGGNAPLFAGVFLATAALAILSIPLAVFSPWFLLGLIPLPGMLFLLAVKTSVRARSPSLLVPLMILYGSYGLARAIDLIGLSPHKPSWKIKKDEHPPEPGPS